MMKNLFTLFLLSLCFNLVNAQDTICLKTGECFGVKLLEINVSDITYKRSDDLNGPNYTFNKADLALIKFGNSQINSIKQKFVASPEDSVIKGLSKNNPDHVVYKRGKIWINQRAVSSNEFLYLCQKTLPSDQFYQTKELIDKSVAKKNLQLTLSISSIPLYLIGGGSMLVGFIGGYFVENDDVVIPFLYLGGLSIAGGITFSIVRNVQKGIGLKYKASAVNLYNNSNPLR